MPTRTDAVKRAASSSSSNGRWVLRPNVEVKAHGNAQPVGRPNTVKPKMSPNPLACEPTSNDYNNTDAEDVARSLWGRRRNQKPEAQILRAAMDFLAAMGLTPFRQNNGFVIWPSVGHKRHATRFGQPGQSDLWLMFPNGVYGALEAKKPGGRPTSKQVAWIEFVQSQGGVAFWFDSLESLVDQLKAEYGRRGWPWLTCWDL